MSRGWADGYRRPIDTIEVGGLTIGYERAGTGPPLLLLHSGLSDHREWRPQLDGLSDAFTVVAWDAPGAGTSSDPPATFRMPAYGQCLAGFVDALGLERPNVLGLSWGSTLALELYRQRPDLPRTLILSAAYAGWAGSLPPEAAADRLETTLRDLRTLDPVTYARSWIPSLFTPRAPARLIDDYVALTSGFRVAGSIPALYAMAEADLRDVLPTIRVPTLVLSGEEDVRSPLALAREIQTAIPGSELVVLPQVGHLSNLETPELFNAAVRRFLSVHSSR